MIKLNFVFEFIWEMVGHITYLLGRSWRKIPMRNWPPDNDMVTDDYSAISAWCPDCKQKTMQVVRPGSYQCSNCG